MSSDEIVRFLIQIVSDRGQCWWTTIERHSFVDGQHSFIGNEVVCHGRFVRARLFDHLGRQIADDEVAPTSGYPAIITPEIVFDTELEP